MSALVIIVVIVALYMLHAYMTAEDFATRREKANTVMEWFKSTDLPTYTAYKKDIRGSDIVEYERVRSAIANGAAADDVEHLV